MLRISNWNLKRIIPSERRAAIIRNMMVGIGADLWILTETHDAINPGDGFFCVTSDLPDRISKRGERWVAIWSRFRLEALDLFVGLDTARCAAARLEHPELGKIVVFGCVLPWLGSAHGEG